MSEKAKQPLQAPSLAPHPCNVFDARATKTEIRVTFAHQFVKDEAAVGVATIIMSHENARWLADYLEKIIQEAEAL